MWLNSITMFRNKQKKGTVILWWKFLKLLKNLENSVACVKLVTWFCRILNGTQWQIGSLLREWGTKKQKIECMNMKIKGADKAQHAIASVGKLKLKLLVIFHIPFWYSFCNDKCDLYEQNFKWFKFWTP